MPLYSIKEFADLTGKEPKHLYTYINRGQIVKTDNRKIDSSEPLNALFFEKYKIDTTPKINEPKKQTKKSSKKNEIKEEKEEKDKPVKSNVLTNLELEKKLLEIEKLKKDNLIKDEELKKRRGETIDLESTLNLIKSFSDSLKRELSQQMQIFIQDICARHGVDSGKAGEYKMKVPELVNKSSNKSVQILKGLK